MSHPNDAVICRSRAEFHFMVTWCEDNGKGTPYMSDPDFPFVICPYGEGGATWTDLLDRALYYMEFDEFVSRIKPPERVAKGE